MKIKSGQLVKVISGKNKSKQGKVVQVFPDSEKIVVEGVNTMYKHISGRKVSGKQKGERVEFFGPIHISNVKIIEQEKEKKDDKKTDKQEKPVQNEKKIKNQTKDQPNNE